MGDMAEYALASCSWGYRKPVPYVTRKYVKVVAETKKAILLRFSGHGVGKTTCNYGKIENPKWFPKEHCKLDHSKKLIAFPAWVVDKRWHWRS